MHRAALAALVATAFASTAVAPLAGCRRSTGVEVSIELFLDCDAARGTPIDVQSLRLDVAPCGPAAGGCSVTAVDQFLTGSIGQVVYVEAADLSPLDPLQVLLENVDGMAATWVRIFATAISPTGENVATGWLDVYVDQAGLLRPAEPLVLYPETCGYLPDPDYDGDGFVGADDCNGFDPAVNAGAAEDCLNGADDDCDGAIDLDDGECFDPDADGDGICAFGIDQAAQTILGTDVPLGIREACLDRFTDCDDTDPLVGEHCACDADADGFCVDDFFCPHSAAWGLTIVCAPGGDCCSEPSIAGCADVFPGQIESCDGIDNDCDGKLDAGAEGAASCVAFDDGTLTCQSGVYCPGNQSNGADECHDLGYNVTDVVSQACSADELGCADPASGPGTIAGCVGLPLSITATPPLQAGTGLSCLRTVILPSDPLLVTITSPAMTTGLACSSFDLTVDMSAVSVAGVYTFYVQIDTTTTMTTVTEVYRFDVDVGSTCGPGGAASYVCNAG